MPSTDQWAGDAALSEHGLPSNILAERLVLGGIILQGNRFGLIRDILSAGDFALDKHQRIWRRMAGLHEAGQHIDRITVYEALAKAGEVEAVDGLSYLVSLDEGLPELFNLESYAEIVAEKALRRSVITAAQSLTKLAANGDDMASIVDQSRALFNGLIQSESNEFDQPGDIVTAAGGLDSYLDQFRSSGAGWPWPGLTQVTAGLFPGELAIIAAGPGGGKSDWALNVALAFGLQGRPGAIFGLEMSKKQQVNRLAAMASGQFNRGILRHELWDHQRSVVAGAFNTIADLPIYISQRSAHSINSIEAGLRRLKAKHDIQWAVVDYLQLVSGKGRSRTEEVGSVANGLKVIGSELGIGMVVPTQINREPIKSGVEPGLYDLRESGSIEQAANLVMFLHVREKIAETSDSAVWVPIDLLIRKQRDGASNFNLAMQWQKSTGRFSEAT